MNPKAIIVDMDDTICKNVTGRLWFGKGLLVLQPKNSEY